MGFAGQVNEIRRETCDREKRKPKICQQKSQKEVKSCVKLENSTPPAPVGRLLPPPTFVVNLENATRIRLFQPPRLFGTAE